ncbi:ATP-binding protein [Methylobacterium sp. J-090]|uniref:ATP-binding protein n=1 Tax=Methylobacterium sp. J-090 TaxID=2836666 RepID=UPI001FBACAE9|nr:ATP-binding protein [Methylobacterium sp. J-090]MCJ2080667.1 ATP-binding protein [Methylobacterium sp. J-090]
MAGDVTLRFSCSAPQASVEVKANTAGFNAMACLHRDLSGFHDANIIVEFSKVAWFDGHLTAALDLVFRQAACRRNVVRLSGLRPRLRDTFCKNHLISKRKFDRHNTVMPIRAFEVDQALAFSGYAKRHLDRPEMPNMTAALRRCFFESIDEIFANAALHARASLPVIVGGQYFPRRQVLAFAIVDGGEGMQRAVCAKLHRALSPAEAIAWAMEPYNTTRQGDVPGGLGSKVLREFIEENGGRITVVSAGGLWQQHGALVSRRHLAAPYPGTAVLLEMKTIAALPHRPVEIPDPNNIW